MADQPPLTTATIKEAIETRVPTTHVQVVDQSGGCGTSFEWTVVSPEFDGLRKLGRDRIVLKALEQEMKLIHAYKSNLKTPAEWDKLNAAS